jgi:hypothetical protein
MSVDVTYGRIGVRGRTIRHVVADEAVARTIIRHCLQRRASAPKRIGVGYRVCELDDPHQWLDRTIARRSSGCLKPIRPVA